MKDLYLSKRCAKNKLTKKNQQEKLKEYDEGDFKGIRRGSQVANDIKEFILKCYFDVPIVFYMEHVSDFMKIKTAMKFYCLSLMSSVLQVFDQFHDWNRDSNFILNVTHVEQKQIEFANKKGELQYDFIVDDYNESLELFANDLSQKIEPDIASRFMTLCRAIYGNRTEVETALVSSLKIKIMNKMVYIHKCIYSHFQSYLYGPPIVFAISSPTNETVTEGVVLLNGDKKGEIEREREEKVSNERIKMEKCWTNT